MDSSRRLKQHPKAVFAELDGATALFQSGACAYLVLNESGSFIWSALAAQPTLAELCALLQREYDVSSDQCRADLEAWLKQAPEGRVVSILDG